MAEDTQQPEKQASTNGSSSGSSNGSDNGSDNRSDRASIDQNTTVRISRLTESLDAWEASGEEMPPTLSHREGQDFTSAVRGALAAAEEVGPGHIPAEWLAAYLTEDTARDISQDAATVSPLDNVAAWLSEFTGRTLDNLTQGLSERFLSLRRPLAAFTTQEADETILPDAPIGADGSIFASIQKRGGHLLLRLQSQNADLKNEIVAVLLPQLARSAEESGLFFVAMAATGIGDWSVGWARISETERDALLPDGQMDLRHVQLSDQNVGLLPLLSLAAAEDAHSTVDPLARTVWMDWMERWRRNMNGAPTS